jgi:hypothetical protein
MAEQYPPRGRGPRLYGGSADLPDTAVLPEQPTEYAPATGGRRPARGRFDPGRLWAGGAATALVAALLAVLGILTARGLLDIAVLAPKGEGVWGDANTVTYALVAAACALAATGLVHLLLLTTPSAVRFFCWIMVLLALIAVVLPLSLDLGIESRTFTAVLNFLVGVVITLLVCGAAASARRGTPDRL